MKDAGCYQKTTVMGRVKVTFTVTDRVRLGSGLAIGLGLGLFYEFHLYCKTQHPTFFTGT